MSLIYRNRSIINQRGGSIDIDNTTEQEKIKISQRSGSNVNFTNIVTSELATNNKQTNVVHDVFETVGNDKSEFIAKNYTLRTGENTISLNGFLDETQLDAYNTWKVLYSPIAQANSQFKVKRGGFSYPNGVETTQSGKRLKNPTLGNKMLSVNNTFNGYSEGTSVRTSTNDEVTKYTKVPDHGKTLPAAIVSPTVEDILTTAGENGSNAPGVLEFGGDACAATEQGTWDNNDQKIGELILQTQANLTPIESLMGNGGDEVIFTKRNNIGQIGAIFNDYPSIKIDERGRSQPLEMLVSPKGTYKNHDYIPHVEEIDNSSNFPCGNDDVIVGNRFSRVVGSGGINLKTTGPTELGGTTLKAGYKKININASHGIQIASESSVELQSLKTIVLRTNRQVYVESSLGVSKNLVVGGGTYVEGELYCQHITAPLEVHQTEDATVLGKFATDADRRLVIGECLVGENWYPVYALARHDLIVNYPHSHHHNGIPIRLMKKNEGVREIAHLEGINTHVTPTQSLPQLHERKRAIDVV